MGWCWAEVLNKLQVFRSSWKRLCKCRSQGPSPSPAASGSRPTLLGVKLLWILVSFSVENKSNFYFIGYCKNYLHNNKYESIILKYIKCLSYARCSINWNFSYPFTCLTNKWPCSRPKCFVETGDTVLKHKGKAHLPGVPPLSHENLVRPFQSLCLGPRSPFFHQDEKPAALPTGQQQLSLIRNIQNYKSRIVSFKNYYRS